MNKRIRKKRAKLDPMPCPYCGSKVKLEKWHSWWQVGCWQYACNHPIFIVAKKKKEVIKGWNNLKR